ncbi:TadE family protein [Catelliglobosispora koreensis]|uniref:TadE family protein n=1 Tax=Catelliglobosispora koreensis TaxID=129052 RepID=UPI00035FC5C2|nr:TadE family protein [Catelliglobosispora koreensis]
MTRRGSKARPDRGSGPVELAILAIPLLVMTFMVAQAAFVFYARSTALAAATQGANSARSYNASPNAGIDRANNFLVQVRGGGLRNHTVSQTVNASGTEVTITVTGDAPSIIPFWTYHVRQRATGPVERWVP